MINLIKHFRKRHSLTGTLKFNWKYGCTSVKSLGRRFVVLIGLRKRLLNLGCASNHGWLQWQLPLKHYNATQVSLCSFRANFTFSWVSLFAKLVHQKIGVKWSVSQIDCLCSFGFKKAENQLFLKKEFMDKMWSCT